MQDDHITKQLKGPLGRGSRRLCITRWCRSLRTAWRLSERNLSPLPKHGSTVKRNISIYNDQFVNRTFSFTHSFWFRFDSLRVDDVILLDRRISASLPTSIVLHPARSWYSDIPSCKTQGQCVLSSTFLHCGKSHLVAIQAVNTQIVREARTPPLVKLYYTVSYCIIMYIVVGLLT
jgi:hypothetical protein